MYRQTTLSEISGRDNGIDITFRNYPVRVSDDSPPRRIEYYPDFIAGRRSH
jgi:hypothetical protein